SQSAGYNRRGLRFVRAARIDPPRADELLLQAGYAVHTPGSLFSDRILMTAFVVSLAVHAGAMAIRFIDPELIKLRAAVTPLEIILVNARSETAPTNAEALAQANLDGGGANEHGRRSSPLPNTFEMRDGDSLESAQRVVEQLEEEQKKLLAQLRKGDLALAPARETKPMQADVAAEANEARKRLARMQAEISKQISDYQKRPRKHHFMPSASEYRFARYVEDWRGRVERIGNENYPVEARGKIYGTLRMTVAVRKDGSLVDATIEQSSGSAVLDRAARRIVKLAAPFPPFPPEIARDTDVLEITRTWVFTNDQLATRSTGAGSTTARTTTRP
ncbi:MAG TPA: TonB family protein, partial [Burkholderiaceae bacterium]|nr:TonB family protein [Burkholderiaceae bacterium]